MQLKMHMVTIEDLVPKGHFLRKLESALDLSFVYEETQVDMFTTVFIGSSSTRMLSGRMVTPRGYEAKA